MIKVKVTGMTCGHCEAAVTKALESVPGVQRVVEVSREKELAVIEGDAFVNELVTVIEEEGYEAEPLA